MPANRALKQAEVGAAQVAEKSRIAIDDHRRMAELVRLGDPNFSSPPWVIALTLRALAR